jgi:hypothetical protein
MQSNLPGRMPRGQTAVMPFQPKPRGDDYDAAVAAFLEADAVLRDHDQRRPELVAGRAEATRRALEAGATLDSLAELLGVSPSRIRQMRDGR